MMGRWILAMLLRAEGVGRVSRWGRRGKGGQVSAWAQSWCEEPRENGAIVASRINTLCFGENTLCFVEARTSSVEWSGVTRLFGCFGCLFSSRPRWGSLRLISEGSMEYRMV